MKTHTKGNVIVEDIKVGDIHYEFEYGVTEGLSHYSSNIYDYPAHEVKHWV